MKRFCAWMLVFVMLFTGMFACKKTDTTTATPTDAPKATETTAEPTAEPTTEPTAEPTEEPTAEPTPEPTEEPTPEPTAKPTPDPATREQFAQFDREFFIEYVSSDLTTLQQYVKHPEELGIDINEVPITLGSYSKEDDDKWNTWYAEKLEKLHAINRDLLTEQEQIAYDVIEHELVDSLNMEQYYGCYEPLRQYVGIQTNLPLDFWFFDINNKWDAEAYLTLLADVPRFYKDLLEYEQYRASIGLFMTENNLDEVLKDLDDIIKVRDTIFLITTYNEAVDKLTDVTPKEAKELKQRNYNLLVNDFYQAHVDLKEGLEALRGSCRKAFGAAASKNEMYYNYYRDNLMSTCSDNKTPEEIQDLLFAQIQKTEDEYRDAVRDLGYYPESDTYITVGNTEDTIAYLHDTLDPIYPEIPEVNVSYENVPEELADMLSPAFYLNPSFDDWQNNLIGLNQPEKDDNLVSTLAHEGFNGHLYQFMYHRSMEGLSWSQQLLESTCYAEAWSQESERMLAIHGKGRLNPNLMMALHADSVYSTCLLAYCSIMINNEKLSAGQAAKKIEEKFRLSRDTGLWIYQFSVDNPIYYMNYAYSYTRLQDLHDRMKDRLGDKFTDKEFFKAYLDVGPAPFNMIEEKLDAWAQAQ